MLLLLCLASPVATLHASMPWSGRDYRQWTAADIEQVLTDSPWARPASAVLDNSLLSDERGTFTPPVDSATATGMAGATGRQWDGGPGRQRGRLPTIPVTVRWDSALPVSQAFERSHQSPAEPIHSVLSGLGNTHYVITLIGLWPGERKDAPKPPENFEPPGRPDDSPRTKPSTDVPHIREELMKVAKLLRHGKPPILPDNVLLNPVTGDIHLVFPRTDAITKQDKEVLFQTRFGPMQVQQRFRLKDMTYQGGLAL